MEAQPLAALVFFWAVYPTVSSATFSTPSHVVLSTKLGTLRGTVSDSGAGPLTRFVGIPYAQSPARPTQRFQRPLPHNGWTVNGTWDATWPRPRCPQLPFDESAQSEDCLYLDIFVPRNLSSLEHISTVGLPVVFYIDGNGFQNLSAAVDVTSLSQGADVIVSRVQYRVGVLGFLSQGLKSNAPGNAGLWDQRMALHWVWDNVREFGGDPEKITLFGNSAGGASVGYHVLSPKSRGFFRRAISNSANMASPGYIQRHPVEAVKRLASLAGCPSTSALSCLQRISLSSLMEITSKLERPQDGSLLAEGFWLPVVDEEFLPDSPLKLIREGSFNPVDYIIGIHSTDGLALSQRQEFFHKGGVSQRDLEQILRSTLEELYGAASERLFLAALLEYSDCASNVTSRLDILVSFYTDVAFLGPVHMAARAMAHKKKDVYVYQYSEGGHSRTVLSVAQKAPSLGGQDSGRADVELLRHRVLTAWRNFIWSGDPNPFNELGLYWKAFDALTPQYMELNTQMSRTSLKTGFTPRRMAFWNDYVPALLDSVDDQCSVGKGVCRQEISAAVRDGQTAFTATLILSCLCTLLLLLVLILAIKLWVPRVTWSRCLARNERVPINGSETRKLQPLPYYDET